MEFSKARRLLPLLLVGLAFPVLVTAASPSKSNAVCMKILKNFAPATYVLESRTLKNGKVLQGSHITGSLAFSKNGYRTLSVAIDNGDGTFLSVGIQSRFKIKAKEFSDTNSAVFYQMNVSADKPTTYVFGSLKGSLPVVCENDALVIKAANGNKFPIDPVTEMRITPNGLSASLEGGIVDKWKRVD